MSSSAEAFALLQRGAAAAAEAVATRLLEANPQDINALHVAGLAAARLGRLDEGLSFLARALEHAPRDPNVLNNRALLLAEAGRLEEAERDLRRAVQAEPRFYAGFLHLGSVLRRLGRLEEATAAFRKAQALEPGRADATAGLANVQHDRAAALVNGANVLKENGELAQAAHDLEAAIAIAPDLVEAVNNRASLALEAGELDTARAYAERALVLQPGFAEARVTRAQVALHERDYARGWPLYEARFHTSPPLATWRAPELPPLGDGDLGRGLKLAVWREQGVGDQLLYATLLPALLARGVVPVVELDERLLPLFRRNFPGVAFTSLEDSPRDFAGCERHVPLGTLPSLLRNTAAAFGEQPRGLLRADPARVAAIREELGPGRWIAVSWRSFQPHGLRLREQRKSVPLERLARLLAVPGVRLLDLQYGDVAAERNAFAAAHPGALRTLERLDTFHDFDGMLAAIEACEAVATVSNVTTHLAGVAGQRAWVLFTAGRPPFHYWGAQAGAASPWYPSVESATRAGSESWDGPVEHVLRALQA